MSTATEPRPPSYAAIEALPPHVVGEILGGELVVSPRPAPKHTCASSVLGALITTPFHLGVGGPGGWWILDEPELSLGVDPDFDPVVPDLAGWRRDAHPSLPVTPQHHDAPQWVCEVLSPSTRRRDRILKVPFYARAGVEHVWLVDPEAETVEVYELARVSHHPSAATSDPPSSSTRSPSADLDVRCTPSAGLSPSTPMTTAPPSSRSNAGVKSGLTGGRWVLLGTWGDGKARLAPFDAVELDLSLLWDRGPAAAAEPADG